MKSSSVRDWLKSEGWATGDVMAGDAVNRIASSGASRWAEITGKDKPIEFRATKEMRHGIDLDYWQECLRTEYETCIPGALFIIQHRPFDGALPAPRLLVQWFSVLRNIPVQEIPPRTQAWAPTGLIAWRAVSFVTLGDPESSAAKGRLRAWVIKEAAEPDFLTQPMLPL